MKKKQKKYICRHAGREHELVLFLDDTEIVKEQCYDCREILRWIPKMIFDQEQSKWGSLSGENDKPPHQRIASYKDEPERVDDDDVPEGVSDIPARVLELMTASTKEMADGMVLIGLYSQVKGLLRNKTENPVIRMKLTELRKRLGQANGSLAKAALARRFLGRLQRKKLIKWVEIPTTAKAVSVDIELPRHFEECGFGIFNERPILKLISNNQPEPNP